MESENLLHLLIIESSEERAEEAISVLRNSGLAVRPRRAENEEQVQEVLESVPIDMILTCTPTEGMSLEALSAVVGRSGKDIPVIAIIDGGAEETVAAMRQGARGVALKGSPDLLQRVVRRELENIHVRRQLRHLEASNRENAKRADALLDSSRDAIAYVHEGMHVYANRAYLENFGFDDFDEVEGMPVLDLVETQSTDALKSVLRSISKGEKPPRQLEVQTRRVNGETLDTIMVFSSASIEGEPCTQIVLRSKHDDSELAQQLSELKTQDLVTGLRNRQYLMGELDHAMNEILQGEGSGTVIYLELDEFRTVIQQVGIGGTDLTLGDVAKLIKQTIDEDALAARFGDSSFGILKRGASLKEVEALAEKLRAAVEGHISEVGKQSITLTCSLGVAPISEHAKSAQEVISDASDACNKAQADGGNRVHIYNPAAADQADREQSALWLEAIRDSLENDRLVLVFQPIVSLHGVTGEFYEILLRLQKENGDLVMPAEFLPVAAQNDLMGEIDRWVIEHTIKLIKERTDKGHDTTFFVKLSPESLDDSSLLGWLSEQLTEQRVQGDKLVFEMPESRVVTHMKPARRFVEGLKQLHCNFALEQFGSGLNSFQLLKHLPADYLKIDRTFMQDLAGNPENKEKVKAITEQAHANGKQTIAEFVEDAASMSVLWQFGVNFVQGNFLQEPEKVLAYDFGE